MVEHQTEDQNKNEKMSIKFPISGLSSEWLFKPSSFQKLTVSWLQVESYLQEIRSTMS
jgi:hypothetical protein